MASQSPSLLRRERERSETRRLILEAARRMFVEHGYEATTMRSIAAKIGYTATAVYHHFKDKTALVAELCAIDFRALTEALRKAGSVTDPLERLGRMGEAYVEFGLSHPMQYQFMFMMPRPAGIDGHPDPGADCYGYLLETCRAVVATGRLRPEFADADQVAQIAWGALHGLVALQVTKGDDDVVPWRSVRDTAAKMGSALIRGMLRET
ncbi:MAG TPA: TetR/AcrR family transcriptional regulator [Gemmatimonadales bacterium]|nr:TetR/AcrR family transcriptional regulator [Gemmatimonadales bacterium]